jgi:hypothetical protein
MWGAPDAVRFAVRANSERLGMPMPAVFSPFWERGGDFFYNVGRLATIAQIYPGGTGRWVGPDYHFGATAHASDNDPSGFNLGVGDFTIEMIAKVNPTGNQYQTLICQGRHTISPRGWQIYQPSTVSSWRFYGQGFSLSIAYSFSNYKTHMVISRKNDQMFCFFSNRFSSNATLSGDTISGNSVDITNPWPTVYGARANSENTGYENFLDGTIEYVRLWNDWGCDAATALRLENEPYALLMPVARPLYFDLGASAGTDNLTASDLVIGSPVIGTPALGQVHALTATGITTSAPVLAAPALGQVHRLSATALTVSPPVLGTPAVGQIHSLTTSALVVGSPVLGTPLLTENAPDVDALTAVDLVVGSPVLGTPSLGQIHVLGSDGLVTGAPVLGSPSMVQVHELSALGLTVGAPVLGTPILYAFDIPSVTLDEVSQTIYLQSRIKTVYLKHRIKSARY